MMVKGKFDRLESRASIDAESYAATYRSTVRASV
jgi:hypothetical protein